MLSPRCVIITILCLAASRHVVALAAEAEAAAAAAESEPTCTDAITQLSSTSDDWRETMFDQIIADDYESLDSTLPGSVATLKKRRAHLCWHKHSTFLEHLLGVHHILRLWGQGETVGRVGLLHSAYSNSYVNLALFDPNDENERTIMKDMIGAQAEELVHLFCIIDRQDLVVNVLLRNYNNKDGVGIPPDGIYVPHLRHPHNETVFLSAETLRMLLVFSMADVADQHFGWQDRLFSGDAMVNGMYSPSSSDNNDPANKHHQSTALWPGLSQPGLWMSYASSLGAIARTFQFESSSNTDQTTQLLVADLPPVFDNCTKLLSGEDEAKARDLYWSVVTDDELRETDAVIDALEQCVAFNPWAFEPYVILAQKYLHRNDFEHATRTTERALELQLQWGTAWDKRLSFNAWVAWTRVLHQRAQDELDWPQNSFDVNNFGMVR
jgi:hypothetical protein